MLQIALLLALILPPIPAVDHYAEMYDVDPDVVRAIVWVESYDNPGAVGGSGEQGWMQILPGTAEYIAANTNMTAEQIFNNPTVNIRAGTWLFAIWFHRFESVDLALSAYNGGAGYVIEYRTVNPTTEHYVWKVKETLGWNWPSKICMDESERCLVEDKG